MLRWLLCYFFFFFNDTATTEIYTLSLHDALPISEGETREYPRTIQELPPQPKEIKPHPYGIEFGILLRMLHEDRKSTRLNSSHLVISYAVFCLKKKKNDKYMSCIR